MPRLFGTDGVRGVAGTELSEDLACALGRAAVRHLGPRVLIGRDSRVSGPMLEQALVDGIAAEGGTATLAGIVPTPAVALGAAQGDYDCGIVISASHNPPEYNGIKFFSAEGFKLPDATEDEMQKTVEALRGESIARAQEPAVDGCIAENYIAAAVAQMEEQGVDLHGMRIALDCAHGAACTTTPEALKRLGAEVFAINTDPDGENINVGCGSTHLGPVTQLLEETGADIALAHDGDADRMLAVAPGGAEIDGDYILAICAKHLKERGELAENTVVGTVMCNLGFQKAMEREGIRLLTTKVGDRYVLECMREEGAIIGGEQSGHVIFLNHNTTGDGLATALQLLACVASSGKPVTELMQVMEKFPQTLVNVKVRDKALYAGNAAIQAAEAKATEELGGDGRLLVRPSGTEPLIRVMVEAQTQAQAEEVAERVAAVIREQIGA